MIIDHWRSTLVELGFIAEEDDYFKRTKGCIFQYIYERTILGQTRICLSIGINDPFKEAQVDSYALTARLRPDKTVLEGFGEQDFLWNAGQRDQALHAFQSHGLKWFDKRSDLENLIEFFEVEWLAETQRMQRQAQSLLTLFLERHVFKSQGNYKVKSNPPIHDYYLSLLHFAAGDCKTALEYAKRRLGFVTESICLEGEPERTIRQIAAIESSLKTDEVASLS